MTTLDAQAIAGELLAPARAAAIPLSPHVPEEVVVEPEDVVPGVVVVPPLVVEELSVVPLVAVEPVPPERCKPLDPEDPCPPEEVVPTEVGPQPAANSVVTADIATIARRMAISRAGPTRRPLARTVAERKSATGTLQTTRSAAQSTPVALLVKAALRFRAFSYSSSPGLSMFITPS